MKIKELKESDALYSDLESRIDAIKSKKNRYVYYYHISQAIILVAGGAITVLTAADKQFFETLQKNRSYYVQVLE